MRGPLRVISEMAQPVLSRDLLLVRSDGYNFSINQAAARRPRTTILSRRVVSALKPDSRASAERTSVKPETEVSSSLSPEFLDLPRRTALDPMKDPIRDFTRSRTPMMVIGHRTFALRELAYCTVRILLILGFGAIIALDVSALRAH